MTPPFSSLKISEISQILFESAAEGLVVADSKGIIQLTNPRIQEMFGYEKGELIGEAVEILIPSSLRKQHRQHRRSYVDAPSKRAMGIGMDLIAQRKDGSEFPVEVSLNHFELHGHLLVMALISDVTERKKVDHALQEMNQELEKMVTERTQDLKESQRLHSIISRNFPNGTINVFDRDLNYVFVEGMEMYRLGIDGSRLVGTSYLERLDPEIREEIREKLLMVFEGENFNFEIEFKGRTYMINAVALPDDEGHIQQILVVEQNITPLKKAQNDIREALQKERQLSELKSRFVSMASHEFRTPLTTVLSSLTLLKKYIEGGNNLDRQLKHIGKIKSSVYHLTNILNDFLSLDKLEEGKVEVTYQTIQLGSFLSEVAEDMGGMLKEGQTIEIEINRDTEWKSDPNILRNILHNLLSNAAKYSPAGSIIALKSHLTDSTVTISVSDQGMGIPEDEQQHLFERFFRAKNVTNIEGTGLGLSIVKKYVDLLNGEITLRSELERGTTISIQLAFTQNNNIQ